MSGKSIMWVILAVIVVTVGSSAVYYVDEREKAIVFSSVRSFVPTTARTSFKAPLINNVKILLLMRGFRRWIPIRSCI